MGLDYNLFWKVDEQRRLFLIKVDIPAVPLSQRFVEVKLPPTLKGKIQITHTVTPISQLTNYFR